MFGRGQIQQHWEEQRINSSARKYVSRIGDCTGNGDLQMYVERRSAQSIIEAPFVMPAEQLLRTGKGNHIHLTLSHMFGC